MPKRHSYDSQMRLTPAKKEVHPIWRGVGLIFIILIPIISISLALLLVAQNQENRWLSIPKELLVKAKDPLILVKVILSVAFILILFAIFTFITVLANRLFGPPRYGPYDVPAEKFKRRRR